MTQERNTKHKRINYILNFEKRQEYYKIYYQYFKKYIELKPEIHTNFILNLKAHSSCFDQENRLLIYIFKLYSIKT